MTDDQVRRLVRQLARMGHTSTFEHVTFTFAIEGVSRVLTQSACPSPDCVLFPAESALREGT